jgi:hypothetical protein
MKCSIWSSNKRKICPIPKTTATRAILNKIEFGEWIRDYL